MTTASPVLAAELQAYINYGLFGPVPVYWNDLSNERGQHRTREITPRLAALVFSTSVNCSTSTRLLKPKSQVLFLILFVLSLPESQLATRSAGSTSKIYPKCIHSVPLYCQCPSPSHHISCFITGLPTPTLNLCNPCMTAAGSSFKITNQITPHGSLKPLPSIPTTQKAYH